MISTFKNPEVNEALTNAYEWATEKEFKSVYARAAKAYIEAISANRWEADMMAEYAGTDPDNADHIQLLYIMSNLQYWKGDKAREAKATLKNYVDSINKKGN